MISRSDFPFGLKSLMMIKEQRWSARGSAHRRTSSFGWAHVPSTFTSSNGQHGETVFEDLLKSQELEDGKIDGRMETQSAFVRSKTGAELHSIAPVDVDVSSIIQPRDAEQDDPFWFEHSFKHLDVLWMLHQYRYNANKHFVHSLMELGLVWISLLQLDHEFFHIFLRCGFRHVVLFSKRRIRCHFSLLGCVVDAGAFGFATARGMCRWHQQRGFGWELSRVEMEWIESVGKPSFGEDVPCR